MSAQAKKIFISYRRDDAPGEARSIRDRLAAEFGPGSVFMDVDNLVAGQRFDQELRRALAACDIFIAIIGPRWQGILKERLQASGRDYVVEEIRAALAGKVRIVPVPVAGARMPQETGVPSGIRDFLLYQKHAVSHERFGRDVADLIAAIHKMRGTRSRRATSRPRSGPLLAILGVAFASILAGLVAIFVLEEGEAQRAQQAAASSAQQDAERAAQEAEKARREGEQVANARAEADAFEIARQANSLAAYEAYIRKYPNGPNVQAARNAIVTLQERDAAAATRAEADAFAQAQRVNTAEAYRDYLRRYPNGANARAAERAITQLDQQPAPSRDAPFALEALHPDVSRAAGLARSLEKRAAETARRAGDAANRADQAAAQATARVAGHSVVTSPNGDIYWGMGSSGNRQGFGVFKWGSGPAAGTVYRGEWQSNQITGVGRLEFANNPNNGERRSRYAGDIRNSDPTGLGAIGWQDGRSYLGEIRSNAMNGSGVYRLTDGSRYEGGFIAGQRSGLGVLWGRDGRAQQAGQWQGDRLVQVLAR